MKKTIMFFISMFLLSCSLAFAADKPASITWEKDFNKGMELAKKLNKPAMVDFYADWCGWCKKLDKTTYIDKDVVKLSESFVCIKVDTDIDRLTPSKYNVSGLPTIVFLSPKGKSIGQVVGYRDADFFKNELPKILKSSK